MTLQKLLITVYMEKTSHLNIHTKVNVCQIELKTAKLKIENGEVKDHFTRCSFNIFEKYHTLTIETKQKNTPAAILFSDVGDIQNDV